MSHDQIDKDWFSATLTDAYEALGEAVEMLDNGDLEDAEDVLKNKLLHVYAKLNYGSTLPILVLRHSKPWKKMP